MDGASASVNSEISASNQESVRKGRGAMRKRESERDQFGPPSEGAQEQYPVAKGRKLKIVTSNSPAIAAKVKPKRTKKPRYKRD